MEKDQMVNSIQQNIFCDNYDINEAIALAFKTIDVNIRRGILAAGADYGGEWTRDIAINSWNGVSLLNPQVAEKSLWSVTIDKKTIGHQYWDKIIWVIAALNHYKVTGDNTFLLNSYKCSSLTMVELEDSVFDNEYGLFTGPSVFNDGIAGYPEPVYDKAIPSGFVLDHKNSKIIKCFSTNCIYYGAYLSLIEMAELLNESEEVISGFRKKAYALKNNILKYFYSESEKKLYYLIDHQGKIRKAQEGLGISFAVLFGIIEGEKANKLIDNARRSEFGITSIYPDFERYSKEKPGRHNNIIWPFVNGFYALAAIKNGLTEVFDFEFTNMIRLALDEDKGDYNFREIYNPYTGKPDGGWQIDSNGKEIQWYSCKHQTWSATAFISLILYGIAGIKIENNGISFEPYLPKNFGKIQISNIKYRNANLTIIIQGKGKNIKSFKINDGLMENYFFEAVYEGNCEISVELI